MTLADLPAQMRLGVLPPPPESSTPCSSSLTRQEGQVDARLPRGLLSATKAIPNFHKADGPSSTHTPKPVTPGGPRITSSLVRFHVGSEREASTQHPRTQPSLPQYSSRHHSLPSRTCSPPDGGQIAISPLATIPDPYLAPGATGLCPSPGLTWAWGQEETITATDLSDFPRWGWSGQTTSSLEIQSSNSHLTAPQAHPCPGTPLPSCQPQGEGN